MFEITAVSPGSFVNLLHFDFLVPQAAIETWAATPVGDSLANCRSSLSLRVLFVLKTSESAIAAMKHYPLVVPL